MLTHAPGVMTLSDHAAAALLSALGSVSSRDAPPPLAHLGQVPPAPTGVPRSPGKKRTSSARLPLLSARRRRSPSLDISPPKGPTTLVTPGWRALKAGTSQATTR